MNTTAVQELVEQVGGAFREVVIDGTDKYTDSERPLTNAGQRAIAHLLREFPGLNKQDEIELLIDLVAYYGLGEKQLNKLSSVIRMHGLKNVYVAIEYMYELGERKRVAEDTTAAAFKRNNPCTMIAKLAAFIGCYTQATGATIDESEDLANVIEELGGLKKALKHHDYEIVPDLEDRPLSYDGRQVFIIIA